MKYRKIIILIILFNCIVSLIFAIQRDEYSYASGVDNEIEINWGFIGSGNDLIGCNLFRYDSLSIVYTQVNDTIIVSSDNSFSFIDTQNINDTINYKYEIEFVLVDTSYTQSFPIFALKRFDFEVQSDEELNIILEFRKEIGYDGEIYVSWDNIIWSTMSQMYINQTDTLFINPYQFQDYWGNYLLIEFQDWSLVNPYIGYLKLSMNYLIEIIEGTNIKENIVYPSINEITCVNFPNPFNPSTTINYDLPANIKNPVIEIFNIKGERVKTIPVFSHSPNNQVSVVWDGTNSYQNQVSSGIYLYHIKSDEGVLLSKKMLLLK